jgi:3-methylcrotonyl-CoA carboxylase beta subunit
MAGQGFDPNFTFSWPTARIGVMEGDSAVQAIYGPELDRLKVAGAPVPPELEAKIAATRADYERWLDAKYAAARGHCDAVIDPKDTRSVLDFAFKVACAHGRTEHVPLQLLRASQEPAPGFGVA